MADRPESDSTGPSVWRRLVNSVDFERVLRSRSRWDSAHFVLQHVGAAPQRRAPHAGADLSTERGSIGARPVDNIERSTADRESKSHPAPFLDDLWLGVVVPKRHARRAVTRSLLKRQIGDAMSHRAESLPAGMWVVRLRAPFDRAQFPSAASNALRGAARAEIDAVVLRAAGLAAGV